MTQVPELPEWVIDPFVYCPDSCAEGCSPGFPAALTSCTRLRRLRFDFEDAHMACGVIPESISRLIKLQSLTLLGCEVRALPDELSHLTRLTRLDIVNGARHNWMDPEDLHVPPGLFAAIPALKYYYP